jgi:inward rectifier potassium channel
LELFYDLIYVATLIQLGTGLANNVSLGGFGSFFALFVPLWLLWTSVTFFTNRFIVDDFTHRAMIFTQMFAIGSMAVHVGDVMDGKPAVFALSFAVARLMVAALYARVWHGVPEARGFGKRWSLLFAFEAGLWALSAFVPHPWTYVLWVCAVLVALSIPLNRHSRKVSLEHPPDAVHMSERYGLFTIIVLGEAFVKILSHISEHDATPSNLIFGALALGISCCVWWIYFDDVAGSKIRREPGSAFVWIYSHLPLAAAITALGVALKKVIDFPLTGSMSHGGEKYVWLLAGTLSLAFLSVAMIDSVTERRDNTLSDKFRVRVRLLSAGIILLVAVSASQLSALACMLIIASVCVAQVFADLLMSPEKMDLELLEAEAQDVFGPGVKKAVSPEDESATLIRRSLGESVLHGTPSELRSDLYFFLMSGSWARIIGVVGTGYLFVNLIFACLFLFRPDSIGGVVDPTFLDAFSFSVQTISTIGFGGLTPGSAYGDILVAVEAGVGIMGVALVTGVVFSKFSQPREFVLFSNHPVVSTHNGKRTLMFRLGNVRNAEVIDARISVTAMMNEVSQEGHQMRALHDLHLRRDRSPMFALTWTVMHEITEESPLWGLDLTDLHGRCESIIATMTGHDAIYAQTTHARHMYYPEDVRFGHRMVDVVSSMDDGRMRVDYSNFHAVEPDHEDVGSVEDGGKVEDS